MRLPHIFQPTFVWEGTYVDAQSIPHFVFGFMVAYVLHALRFSRWQGFAVIIVLGILWEGFEQITGIRAPEAGTNSVVDVFCNAAGYLAGFQVLEAHPSPRTKYAIAVFAASLFPLIYLLHALGA